MGSERETRSGYTHCRSRDCMEIVVSDNMASPDYCDDCRKAGCHEKVNAPDCECDNPHAYGGIDGSDHCGDPRCCGKLTTKP